MAVTWQLHGSYMAVIWQLHGSYMAVTCRPRHHRPRGTPEIDISEKFVILSFQNSFKVEHWTSHDHMTPYDAI